MQKVLIVEDELLIADMAEEILVGHGYEVCGIVRTVDEAIEMARLHRPALALIDIRLADGGLGTEIGAQLGDLPGLGILYASGNLSQDELSTANGHACLFKPYLPSDLLRGLAIVTDLVATGKTSAPLPRGFQILTASSAECGSPS